MVTETYCTLTGTKPLYFIFQAWPKYIYLFLSLSLSLSLCAKNRLYSFILPAYMPMPICLNGKDKEYH